MVPRILGRPQTTRPGRMSKFSQKMLRNVDRVLERGGERAQVDGADFARGDLLKLRKFWWDKTMSELAEDLTVAADWLEEQGQSFFAETVRKAAERFEKQPWGQPARNRTPQRPELERLEVEEYAATADEIKNAQSRAESKFWDSVRTAAEAAPDATSAHVYDIQRAHLPNWFGDTLSPGIDTLRISGRLELE